MAYLVSLDDLSDGVKFALKENQIIDFYSDYHTYNFRRINRDMQYCIAVFGLIHYKGLLFLYNDACIFDVMFAKELYPS